jgi:hypothetical protein
MIRKPLKLRDANQVRFIRTLVLGAGFVASLYSKVAQQHGPTSGGYD